MHADQAAVKHRKAHRLGTDAVKGRQALAAFARFAFLAVVVMNGFFLRVFVLRLNLRGQPPEDNQFFKMTNLS